MADGTHALELLAEDHQRVEELFVRLERTADPQERTEIVHAVIHELAVHGEVEELIFYPRLRVAVPDGHDLAERALHEHGEIKETLNVLDRLTAADGAFDGLVRALMDDVRQHVAEEEHDLFPTIREAVSDTDLRGMGDLMSKAKALVPTRPHPRAPTNPIAKLATSAPVTLVDRVRDALRQATTPSG